MTEWEEHLKKWPDRPVEPEQWLILARQKAEGEISESDFDWLIGHDTAESILAEVKDWWNLQPQRQKQYWAIQGKLRRERGDTPTPKKRKSRKKVIKLALPLG